MMNVSIKSGITDLGSSSSSNQQHLIGKYSIGAEIGRGSFANVYKGYDTTTNKPVAVKSVFRNRLKNKKLIENLEVEIKILQKLKNPHIVGLNDCIQTERHIHLFMEYCSLGDLSYFIKKRDDLLQTHPIISSILERYPSAPGSRGLHKTLVVNFLKQLSCALEFLRSQNLVHRDIKPQNLLLLPPVHSKNEFIEKGYNGLWELPVLKIADFGFARFLPSTSMAETLCGSPLYMAPEILRYEKYNAKADLWSVGAVIYEMSVGKPPFKASTPLDLLKKIERGKDEIPFPTSSQVCDELVRLICGLLKANPTERMGFQEFFNDPLIISDIECADEPLDCDIEEVDEQLFISEYLPNKNKMFGENYNTNNNNNKINSPIVEEDEPLSSDQQDKSSLQKQQQQQQQKQLKNTSSNIPKQERKKSESPADSLLYTVKNGTRIPSPMESSENDEIIKTLITKNSPTSTNNNNTGTTTNEFSNAKLKTSKSKNSKSDVLFEKDYVVVEKRTVEVNALADELANVGINEGNHQNTNNTTNNNSLGNAIAGPLIRRYSSSSRSNTGNSGSNNGRRTSFGDRKMPISISPSNALTKALGFTSNRLFNSPSQQQQQQQLHLQQAQLHQQQQHHHNLQQQQQQQQQSFIDSASTHLNKKLLTPSTTTTTATTTKLRPLSSDDSHSNYDDNELIHQLENLSTMAHAISLFAEVKFSQLIPLPPSVVSTNIDLSDDDDYLNSNNGNLPPQMTKTIAEEGVALYVKTLTLLAKAMSLASDWWYNNNNTTKNSTSPKLNELVQWIRSRFNESLEKAEFLKLRLAEANELLNSDSNSLSSTTLSNTPIAEKLIFDRSLEMSRTAALNELRNEDLIGCELCYSTATWMLESLLTNTSTTNNNNDSINDDSNSSSGKLDANDRKTVELFINSIGNRLQILRIKIEKQQQLALQQQQQQHSNNHHQEKP